MGSENKDFGQIPVFPSDEWRSQVAPGAAAPALSEEETTWLHKESGGDVDLYSMLLERERIIEHVVENGRSLGVSEESSRALGSLTDSIAEAKRKLPPSR